MVAVSLMLQLSALGQSMFSNPNSITIVDSVAASPYPSTITVSGLAGKISKTVVTLNEVTHTSPDDINVLLVSPDGKKVLLMSNAGAGPSAIAARLIFDDSAPEMIPRQGPATFGKPYKPSNYGANGATELISRFAFPAPEGPYVATLSEFNGSTGNGQWSLYVMDDSTVGAGSIANGWTLNFQTPVTIAGLADQTILEDALAVQSFTLEDEPGRTNDVTAASSDQSVIANANITLSGSATDMNRTITVKPNRDASGAAAITVTAMPRGEGEIPSIVTFTVRVISVNDPPIFAPARIDDQLTVAGAAKSLVFDVTDIETSTKDLTVQAHSSNQALLPDANLVPRLIAPNDTRFTLLLAPSGIQSGRATVTVTASDGSNTASNVFSFTVNPPDTPLFANTAQIMIPDGTIANRYPSTISVANVAGDITRVIVTLAGLTHKFPDDLDILLVGPSGQKAVLMSDAGGGNSLADARIVLDPGASDDIPDNNPIGSGTFRPADYEVSDAEFPAPAPAGLTRPAATAFAGANPNGDWKLYMVDDHAADAGTMSGGWLLNILTTAPLITGLSDVTVLEDTAATLSFTLVDPDTDLSTLKVDAISGNTDLVVNSGITFSGPGANRTVTITPLPNAPLPNKFESATITFRVSDGTWTNSKSIQFTVTPVNDAPTFEGLRDSTIKKGGFPETPFVVVDVDTDPASITVTSTAANTNVIKSVDLTRSDAGNWKAVFIRGTDQIGSTAVTFVASDGLANTAQTSAVTFEALNEPPTIDPISSQVTSEGVPLKVGFRLRDPDTRLESLEVTATSSDTALLPVSGIAFNRSDATNTVTLTPAPNQSGRSDVTLSVTDGTSIVTTSFLLEVSKVDDPPSIAPIADVTVDEDAGTLKPIAFTVNDMDTPIASLSVTANSSNPGLIPAGNIDLKPGAGAGNWTASLTPATNQFGTAMITMTVSDGTSPASTSFTVTVNPVNDAPIISFVPDQIINEDESVTVPVTIFDLETETGSLSITFTSSDTNALPATNIVLGGSGNSRTILLRGATNASGVAIVTIMASDGELTTVMSFVVTILAVNDPPVITVNDPPVWFEDEPLPLVLTVSDVDNDESSVTLSSNFSPALIKSLDFDGTGRNRTAVITPVPNANGPAKISIIASDGLDQTTHTLDLTIRPIEDPTTFIPIDLIQGDQKITRTFFLHDVDTPPSQMEISATADQPVEGEIKIIRNGTDDPAKTLISVILTPKPGQGPGQITIFVTDRTTGSSLLNPPHTDNFPPVTWFGITTIASPANGGTISGLGTGTFKEGSIASIVAIASPGYGLTNWTDGGQEVSRAATYPFPVTGNRTLVANFTNIVVTGSITVTILPSAAADAGAQWKILEDSVWLNSGATRAGLALDSYDVEFKAVSGWSLPKEITVSLGPGAPNVSVSGLYCRQFTHNITNLVISDDCTGTYAAARITDYQVGEDYLSATIYYQITSGDPAEINQLWLALGSRIIASVDTGVPGANTEIRVRRLKNVPFNVVAAGPQPLYLVRTAFTNPAAGRDAYEDGLNYWRVQIGEINVLNRQPSVKQYVVSPESTGTYSAIGLRNLSLAGGTLEYDLQFQVYDYVDPAIDFDDQGSLVGFGKVNQLFLATEGKVLDNLYHGTPGAYPGVVGVRQKSFRMDLQTDLDLGTNAVYAVQTAAPSIDAGRRLYERGEGSRVLIREFVVVDVKAAGLPSVGGSVSGGGRYVLGEVVNLVASPSPNYIFGNWTENGAFASASPAYGFKADKDRILIANFAREIKPTFSLATSRIVVSESNEVVNITVRKLEGPAGTVTYFTTTNGLTESPNTTVGLPAIFDQGDFRSVTNTLNMPEGANETNVTVSLVNDQFRRTPPDRMFRLQLAVVADKAELAEPSFADIIIQDDDPPQGDPAISSPPKRRPDTGWLQVRTTPTNTLGGWRIPWELDWRDSGASFGPLEPGPWPVEFLPSKGFSEPLLMETNVVSGPSASPTRASGTYEADPLGGRGYGALRVELAFSDGKARPGGRWQRLDDDDAEHWYEKSEVALSVPAGRHVLLFEDVEGFERPAKRLVDVIGNSGGISITSVVRVFYEQKETKAKNLQSPVPDDLGALDISPYQFCGQLVSEAGFASGILVRPRVVLTAAHVLFQPGATSPVTRVQWLFQRQRRVFEPLPVEAAGWYIHPGYIAARAKEEYPNGLSPAARELDVAAIYFAETRRGGYSGYLISENGFDQWLKNQDPKSFVGYPVASSGMLHEALTRVSITNLPPSSSRNVFVTDGFGGLPGSSGGPLCLNTAGNWVPLAVYLGQAAESAIFRTIDGIAAELIRQAEESAATGQNHTGGGIPFVVEKSKSGARNLKVFLTPAAIKAGIGWRIKGGEDVIPILAPEGMRGLPIGKWTIEFTAKPGFNAPEAKTITISGRTTIEITVDYLPTLEAEVHGGQFRLIVRGAPEENYENFVVQSSGDPQSGWTPLAGSLRTDESGNRDFPVVINPGQRRMFFRIRPK